MSEITRDEAFALLKKYNKDPFHIQHALTVEAVMKWYARELGYGAEEEHWGIVGLLHDIDFELYPAEHCLKAPELLREDGVSEDIIHGVVSHGYGITIEETGEEFRIGCMVTLRDLELDPGLNLYTDGAARESVRHIVGVQFRNLATVGGSIYGRYGFSDVLTMFLAMDSYVELYKGGIIPLKEYAKMPYDRDILVRLIVKKEKAAFDYQSVRNSQTDFPVLTCAAAKTEAGYRFSIGARPGKAVLFELADADIQAADVENMAENAAKCVKEQVETGSNTRGSAEYRKHLAGVLVRRAVCKLAGK